MQGAHRRAIPHPLRDAYVDELIKPAHHDGSTLQARVCNLETVRHDDGVVRRRSTISRNSCGPMVGSEVMRAVEAWVHRELHEYAVALRKLAYSMPNGVGERALLQLSEQMNATAGQDFKGMVASARVRDPLTLEPGIEQHGPTIEEIRAVIPEWPESNGIPWQMCAICRAVYDPTASDPHDHASESKQHGKAMMSQDIVG
jgi:hypothetical protein